MSESSTKQTETLDELRSKVRDLEHLVVELGRETVDATVEAARARIDTLRVRADLGRMDARDELGEQFGEVEGVFQAVRQRFNALTDESSDVGAALLEGLRSARSDLRAAVDLAQERVDAERAV